MIFLTTGSELPFNRLVRAIDEWCDTRGRSDVFGQIGGLGADDYRPTNFEWQSFLEPEAYKEKFGAARLVVAHAGMGSIISALTDGKPILIMPRRVRFRETRNDHQVATLERFTDRENVFGAMEEEEVPAVLDRILDNLEGLKTGRADPYADQGMTDKLRTFLLGGDPFRMGR